MKVRDCMTTDVFAVAADTSVEALVRELVARKISGAPVLGSDGTPCGVVSMRDVLDRERDARQRFGFDVFYELTATATHVQGPDTACDVTGRVEDLMSAKVIHVGADAPVEAAARQMLDANIHRVLVCDEGKLVGVVSTHDILRALLDD